MAIKFFMVQNRTGKTRAVRWYTTLTAEEQKETLTYVHSLISIRNTDESNFFETSSYKIVYKVYASMYFCIGCDLSDNSLGMLEAIHNFVETLNKYFEGVCELDIVFNFTKVYFCLDIMFSSGEISLTPKDCVLQHLKTITTLD